MNKQVYLVLWIQLSKVFNVWVLVWLHQTKIWRKRSTVFMDPDSFTVYLKANDIYKGITEDVENRFDTSNYKLGRPLPKWKQ